MRRLTLKEMVEKEGGVELTPEEAIQLHKTKPSIIVSPGRTNIHDGEGHYYYLAAGPIPGSLRSSPPMSTFSGIDGPLYQINLRTLVLLKGFYPSFYANGPLIHYQGNAKDYSVNVDELIRQVVESPYTKYRYLPRSRHMVLLDRHAKQTVNLQTKR